MRSLHEALIWANSQINKSMNWGGFSQCVAFLRYGFKYVGIDQFPAVTKGAKQIWDMDINPAQAKKIRPADPQPGDFLIYGATKANPSGHCSFVTEVFKGGYIDVSQNINNPVLDPKRQDGTAVASKRWQWPNDRVIGVIRPNYAPDPPKPRPQSQPAAQPAPAAPAAAPSNGVRVSVERYPHKLSTLWGIALKFLGDGTRWPEIYNHPENAALKAKRPDPNIIQPGDVWFVPK